MNQSDLIQMFKSKAETVQAIVMPIVSINDAVRYTVDLTLQQGGQTIAAPGLGDDALTLLTTACQAAGLTVLDCPLRPQADRIHTALTPVDGGIAETGSLVLNSSAEDVRIATMLAETHVAVIAAADIVPDAATLETRLDAALKEDKPSYTAFITGASRTADIERVLAIGVHGPQELHILVWGGTAS